MNIPFLILGYERSGTTLVRRLMSMHPNLEYDIVHENHKILLKSSSKQKAIKKLTYPAKQAKKKTGGEMSILAGQKIAYVKVEMVMEVIKYFRKLFGNIYIVHVLRKPLPTISSQVKAFGKNTSQCIRNYFSSVPSVMKYLETYKGQSINVSYENLTADPIDILSKLYLWMGKEVSEEHIKKVISNKEPWDYKGRTMCGLRRFDSVKPSLSKICLKKSIRAKIKKMKISF